MLKKLDTIRMPIAVALGFVAFMIMISFLLVDATSAQDAENAGAAEKSDKKIVIKSRSGASVTISKAELSTRPRSAGAGARASRRLHPTASDPEPTRLDIKFPTLVDTGTDVRGTLKFYDADDYVFSIFITVFFPDGDVVTESLYDYRIDGGDVYKGTYRFWIELPDSETPLTGKIIITASDEYLNVSEVTQNFALFY